MRDRIIAGLENIERVEGVKIVYAVESGSRVWGFHSVDSDWDVRFIYVRPLSYYLTPFRRRDVLEYPITPDELDFSGWDLKKSCELLYRSNPALLEWLRSPEVYMAEDGVVDRLRALSTDYFNARAALYHYLSMAKNNYLSYIVDRPQVRLKKYLYVVRPLLCCEWILERSTQPPVKFDEIFGASKSDRDPEVGASIASLLHRKRAGEELGEDDPIPELNVWILGRLQEYEQQARLANVKEVDTNAIDAFFMQTAMSVAGRSYP